jgi:hypothetical protein
MKRTKCTFFFITFIVFFFTASGFAQTRDYWLKMERKGIGYGYEHTVLRKLKDGNLEYKTEQHIKTDVAGLNPQDIILEGSYIVDANLFLSPWIFISNLEAKNRMLKENTRMALCI